HRLPCQGCRCLEPCGQRGWRGGRDHPDAGGQSRSAVCGSAERRARMIAVFRAFHSEALKFRRRSVLASIGAMVFATTGISYLTFHQIASGATGPEMTQLIAAFQTPQGLVALLGQARSLIIAIA